MAGFLSNIVGQIGPAYDPFFYDFIVYALGSVILIIIATVIIVPIAIRRKRKKLSKKGDDTQFY